MRVKEARDEIAKRKASLVRRQFELASARNENGPRRAGQLDTITKAIGRTKFKWSVVHNNTATSRAFLCGEAAKLYGLERRRVDDAIEYRIGGVAIVHLKAMNSGLLIVLFR